MGLGAAKRTKASFVVAHAAWKAPLDAGQRATIFRRDRRLSMSRRQSSSSPIRPGTGAALAGLLRRATLAEYRHDIRKIRREVQEGGSIAVTKFGPIEYASEGRGAPALIIHGATGGYDQGLLLARSFAPAGVR